MQKQIRDQIMKEHREAQDLGSFRKSRLVRPFLSTKSSLGTIYSSETSNIMGKPVNTQATSFQSQLQKFKSLKTKTIEEVQKERSKGQPNAEILSRIETTKKELSERKVLKEAVLANQAVENYSSKDNQFYYDSMEVRSLNEFMFFYEILKRIKGEKIHEEQRKLFKAKLLKITELEHQGFSNSADYHHKLLHSTKSMQMPNNLHDQHHSTSNYEHSRKSSLRRIIHSATPLQNILHKEKTLKQSGLEIDARSSQLQFPQDNLPGIDGNNNNTNTAGGEDLGSNKVIMSSKTEKNIMFGSSRSQQQIQLQSANQFMTMKQADIQLVELLERIRKTTKTKDDKNHLEKNKQKQNVVPVIQRGFKAQVINNIVDSVIQRAEKSKNNLNNPQRVQSAFFQRIQKNKSKKESEIVNEEKNDGSPDKMIENDEGNSLNFFRSERQQVLRLFKQTKSQSQLKSLPEEEYYKDYDQMEKLELFPQQSMKESRMKGNRPHLTISDPNEQNNNHNNYKSDTPSSQLSPIIPIILPTNTPATTQIPNHNNNTFSGVSSTSPNNQQHFLHPITVGSAKQPGQSRRSLDYLTPEESYFVDINPPSINNHPNHNSLNPDQVVNQSMNSYVEVQSPMLQSWQPNNTNNKHDLGSSQVNLSVNHKKSFKEISMSFKQKEINKFDIEKRILKNLDKIGAQLRIQKKVHLPELVRLNARAKTAEQRRKQQSKTPFKFSPNFLSNWVDLRAKIETKFDIPSKFHLHKILNQRIKEIKNHKLNSSSDNSIFVYSPEQNDYFL